MNRGKNWNVRKGTKNRRKTYKNGEEGKIKKQKKGIKNALFQV